MVKPTIHELRAISLELTKKAIKEAFTKDILIIQTSHTITELDTVINKLIAVLRERYGYYAPRIAREGENKVLLETVINGSTDDLGVKPTPEDTASTKELALEIANLAQIKSSQEQYLDSLMQSLCPELKKTAGTEISAKLIALAGSLKHLAELPSSTVQVLGAEKALFRHIKTGSKPPRFGIIFSHESIASSKETEKGKAARKLASKISIAARLDYFREVK